MTARLISIQSLIYQLGDYNMKNFFKFAERGTSYKTETLAGITTFLSIAYILVVNPIILSQSGMDHGQYSLQQRLRPLSAHC